MRLISITNNMNCHLSLFQVFNKYGIDVIKYKRNETFPISSDVAIFLEIDPMLTYNELNCIVINNSYFENNKRDKLVQYEIIKKNKLNVIPTYTSKDMIDINLDSFISKPKIGSMGYGVELLNSKSKLTSSNIYQPFIKNDGDWRVVVINKKAVSMIKRKGDGITNNLAQGAVGWAEWDYEAAILAEKCASALDIEYAGIDIIRCAETGIYYFMECNSTTTFDTSQILTGINIAEKLSEYIISTYKNKIKWTKNLE